MSPNTQNPTTPFELSFPSIPSICIVSLAFVGFKNVRFQLTFDSRLEEVARMSFQPLALQLDALGFSTGDSSFGELEKSWYVSPRLSEGLSARVESLDGWEAWWSWDERLRDESFESGTEFKEASAIGDESTVKIFEEEPRAILLSGDKNLSWVVKDLLGEELAFLFPPLR